MGAVSEEKIEALLGKLGRIRRNIQNCGKSDNMLIKADELTADVMDELYSLLNNEDDDIANSELQIVEKNVNKADVPPSDAKAESSGNKRYTFLKANVEYIENRGYIILAGSYLSPTEKVSIPKKAREERRKLLESGCLNENWVMVKDSDLISVKGESTICAIICGYSVSPRLREV